MSILTRFFAWLGDLARPRPDSRSIDSLSPRDWADLPVHHPRCD